MRLRLPWATIVGQPNGHARWRCAIAMVGHEILELLPGVDAHANRWATRYAIGFPYTASDPAAAFAGIETDSRAAAEEVVFIVADRAAADVIIDDELVYTGQGRKYFITEDRAAATLTALLTSGGGGGGGGPEQIDSIYPFSGSIDGGTSVTITGSGFTAITSVKFGSTNAASFTIDSDTQITAVAPAHSAGAVQIHAGGAVSGSSFTYQSSVAIDSLGGQSGIAVAPQQGDTLVSSPAALQMLYDGVYAATSRAGIPADMGLWLDFDDPSHVNLGGAQINSIDDRAAVLTPNNNTKKRRYSWDYGDQPYQDNRLDCHDALFATNGAIHGDAADNASLQFTYDGPCTMFVACRVIANDDAFGLFVLTGGAPRLHFEMGETGGACYVISDGPMVAFVGLPAVGTDWFTATIVSDPFRPEYGERMKVIINGTDLYDGNTEGSTQTPTVSPGPLGLGGVGNFGEVLAYDRLLSDEEQTAVQSYLAGKWLA